MFTSILYISLFYLFCVFATIASLPVLTVLFSSAKDRGFAYAKIFYFLAVSFLTWYSCIIFHLPYSPLIIFSILLVTLFGSFIIYKNKKNEIVSYLVKNKKILIIEEIIFIIAFAFFLVVRFGNPDLWHPVMGGEKPMDMAFINAMVRTSHIPPYDPWLAGSSINYYYFGQFITSTLIKLLGIPSSFFYNIFLSFLFSQSFLGAFSIIYNLTSSKKSGLISGFFLVGIGNLAQIPVIFKSFWISPPINGWYWLSMCDLASPILAIVEHTNFMDKKHYNNEHLVYIGNYMETTDPRFSMTDEQLLELYDPWLSKINPNYKLKTKAYKLFRAPFAQPIIPPHYSKNIPPFDTPLKKVYLANIQQVYPWDRGTNYAVEIGKKVADYVLP